MCRRPCPLVAGCAVKQHKRFSVASASLVFFCDMGWPSGHGQVTNPGHLLVCHGQVRAHRTAVREPRCLTPDLTVSPCIQTSACNRSRQPARADWTRFEFLSVPLAVARALAVAAIAFPICHLVMEAKATTRGVSVKKRTWTCMHVVGEALHKRGCLGVPDYIPAQAPPSSSAP